MASAEFLARVGTLGRSEGRSLCAGPTPPFLASGQKNCSLVTPRTPCQFLTGPLPRSMHSCPRQQVPHCFATLLVTDGCVSSASPSGVMRQDGVRSTPPVGWRFTTLCMAIQPSANMRVPRL